MDIQKLDRTALKAYFVKNAVPTEGNFADLIDGMLNEKEDGLVKLPGEPLSIQADGADTSQKKAINFYRNFADTKPAWTLSLNPRSDPNNAATAKPGWSIGDADGNSKFFVEQGSGRVGIGTIAPGESLEVNGRVKSGPLTAGSWPAGGAAYAFMGANALDQTNGANYALLQGATSEPGRTFLNSPLDIRFRISNADKMIVANNGRVGIGVTAPAESLDVNGRAKCGPLVAGPWPASTSYAFLGVSTLDHATAGNYALLQGTTDGPGRTFLNSPMDIRFRINNVDRMTLANSGRVGIGTATPAELLDVNGNIQIVATGTFTSPGRMHITGGELLYLLHKSGVIVGKEWGGTGNLTVEGDLRTPVVYLGDKWRLSGIGDHEANDEWLRFKNTANTAYYGGVAALKFWANTGGYTGSDVQLKSDVRALRQTLSSVLALRPVRFKWRDGRDNDDDALGLIAQEVEEVFPEVVRTGPDGYKGINYAALVGPMIEAMKEQQAQIEALRAELRLLQAR